MGTLNETGIPMTTLFDSARTVKATRPFARGLSAHRDRRMPFTAADAQWNAENSPANATGYDVDVLSDSDLASMAWAAAMESELDRMAGEAEALDRLTAGQLL